jgi:hypothetical protein
MGNPRGRLTTSMLRGDPGSPDLNNILRKAHILIQALPLRENSFQGSSTSITVDSNSSADGSELLQEEVG